MNIKKIVALALALAMIISVVPMLGITASAAVDSSTSDAELLTLVKSKDPVFDSARDMKTYSGDGPIANAWDGWSGEASADTALNVNGSATAPRIQFYTTGTGNNNNGNTTNIGTVTMPGYGSGNDFVVFSFKPEYTAGWGDVALVDNDDNYITGFRFGAENNAFNVAWGHNGWANPFGSNFTDRYEITTDGGTQTLSSGNNQIDVVLRKVNDNQYTAAYFNNGSLFTAVTYTGSFNGIKTIKMSRGNGGQWQRIALLNPVIYAGNYADFNTTVSVTATYKVNGTQVAQETLTYDSSVASSVTFPKKYYSVDGSNELYYAEEKVLSQSEIINMDLLHNADVGGLKKDGTVKVSGRDYNILSDNLIPNGTFIEGLTGWFSGESGTDPAFNVDGDGKITSTAHQGNAYPGCLYRSWTIEPGATYIFHCYVKNGGEWQVVSLANELGEPETEKLFGNGTSTNLQSDENNYVIKNTDKQYLKIRFRWNGTGADANTYGNFGLYKVEAAATPTNVTVKYEGAGDATPETKTIGDVYVGESYTYTVADAEKVLASADYQKYYEIDAAKSSLEISSLSATAEENVITVAYKPIEFAAANTPAVGSNVAAGEKLYKVTNNTNRVPNPSFETTGGKYSIVGWYGGTNGTSNTSPYPEAHQTSSTDATAGSYSFGSRYGDAWNGLCTLLTSFKVESGKTYYFAYDVKYADNSTPNAGATVSVGIGEGPHGVSKDNDQKTNTNISKIGNNWTTMTNIITVGSDVATDPYIQFNAYYIGNTTNNATMPKFLFDNFILVEVEEAGEIQPDTVAPIDKITVIEGNDPVLPTTVTLTNSEHAGWSATGTVSEWDTSALEVGETKTATGAVDGTGLTATVEVEVLPVTFTMDDQESKNGQPGNVQYLPADIKLTEEFSLEFDLTVNAIKDASVQIGAEGEIFGNGQIGLGTNGNFSLTKSTGDGKNGGAENVTSVAAGETYRIFLTVDPAKHEFTVTLTKADGSRFTRENWHFRKDADYINTITMLTNGGGADGDLKITNVKFYAPSVEISEYAVKYVGVPDEVVSAAGAITSVPTTDGGDLGYAGRKVFPNLAIPYFPGYVFKSKTVSGTTITLTYEATDSSKTFFKGATDTDAPLISLNMLGAHDAFTSNMANENLVDAAARSRGESGSTGSAVATGVTQTQDMTALEMLNHGARYFDIRLSRSDAATLTSNDTYETNGVFYTTHNRLGEEFGPIAFTIAQWAKEHPGEIIILDFQEIWDATPDGNNDSSDRHANTRATWEDLRDVLDSAGIYDLVTVGNSDVSVHTYGSLTNNGEKSNIILIGRANSQGVRNFVYRGTSSADGSQGYLYSYYKGKSITDNTTIAGSYNARYIQWQVDNCAKTGTHYIASIFRVMQGQSESITNLISQANSDNSDLYSDLQSKPTWLTALPIIMVNGVGHNTSGLVDLLQSCNKPIDVTVNYTGASGLPTTKKMMVGTLYTGNHELVSDGNGNTYYVTTETPNQAGSDVIPVPYNGSVTLAVEKLGDVYTISNNEQANRYIDNGDANTKYNGGYTAAYFEGTDPDPYFSAYNWATGTNLSDNRRIGVAILDVADGNAYTLDANRLRDTAYRNKDNPSNQNTISFYAISYEAYKSLDISDFAAVTALLTEENKVASIVSYEDNNTTETPVSISLDAATLKSAAGITGAAKLMSTADTSNKVVILGDSHGGLYRLDQLTIKPYDLKNIVASLGWKDNAFVLNFELADEEGNVVKDAIANIKVTSEGGMSKTENDVDGITVIVADGATNVIYTAAVVDGSAVGPETKASIYSALADEIFAGGHDISKLNPDRITAANKVIAKGGIVYGDDYKLTDETAKIMKLSDDHKTITMEEVATKLGIGFIVTGGKLYVGSADNTIKDGEEGTVYTTLTINGDGTVTLSDEAGIAEAITLSLEAVNIEFIETLISESESDGSDAEFDFIPEL